VALANLRYINALNNNDYDDDNNNNNNNNNNKGHTLDIAPPSERTSLQKRSGMARIVKRSHSFTCTTPRAFIHEWNEKHTSLCLPSRSWSSFTDPGVMEG